MVAQPRSRVERRLLAWLMVRLGVALLILLTAVIVVLAIGTFKAARAGKICAAEG